MTSLAPGQARAAAALLSEGQDEPDAETRLIRLSGLVDLAWYADINAGTAEARDDPVAHFLRVGWRQGLWPNAYFDTGHYMRQNPAIARAGVNPLLHYLQFGEAAACNPRAAFRPAVVPHAPHRRAGRDAAAPLPRP